MSRLRRLVLSDRFFFLTIKLSPRRRPLDKVQFALLAPSLSAVRARQQFLLTAWVFLPDHWHAILFPPYPLTISAAMKSIKLSSTNLLGRCRGEAGEL
jgi:REP element-mobilizing transposase RayT